MLNLKNISMTQIDAGWSGDKKYCMTDDLGDKYLLRISPEGKYDFIEIGRASCRERV